MIISDKVNLSSSVIVSLIICFRLVKKINTTFLPSRCITVYTSRRPIYENHRQFMVEQIQISQIFIDFIFISIFSVIIFFLH